MDGDNIYVIDVNNGVVMEDVNNDLFIDDVNRVDKLINKQ